MSFTDNYNLEEISYGVTGWNAIVTTNFQKIDALGPAQKLVTAHVALTEGDAVYLRGDGEFGKAIADASGHFPALGIATEDISAGADGLMRFLGWITVDSWAWTVGQPIYLDDATPGQMTQTKPAANDQLIGYALTSDTILLLGLQSVNNISTTSSTTTTTTTTT